MSLWVETSSGNRVSRLSKIKGLQNILLQGSSTIEDGVEIDAKKFLKNDSQVVISIGKMCFFDKNVEVSPPRLGDSYQPLQIGSYNVIGENSVVAPAKIGSRVVIGQNCTIGNNVIINDCCVIQENTVVSPNTVIPPFSSVCNDPIGKLVVKRLNESYKQRNETIAKNSYILGTIINCM